MLMKECNVEVKKLQKLYLLKVQQLGQAMNHSSRYRCQVLQAEAEAICDELKVLSQIK